MQVEIQLIYRTNKLKLKCAPLEACQLVLAISSPAWFGSELELSNCLHFHLFSLTSQEPYSKAQADQVRVRLASPGGPGPELAVRPLWDQRDLVTTIHLHTRQHQAQDEHRGLRAGGGQEGSL
jgi:hypothetical protein